MATVERRSVAESVDGTASGEMGAVDWSRLLGSAAVFGSAFLWIAIALESIMPGMLAFGRVALGATALALVPAARCTIARADRPRLLVASAFGIAGPVFLFALAEQRIPSALAGMLVSAIPIFTAVVAAVETKAWPSRERATGLTIGLVGIVLLAAPNLGGSRGDVIGLVMVLAAVLAYSIATTLYAPLQQTYGALRVTMWLLIVSTILLLPLGAVGLPGSSWTWRSVGALLVLGILGTGIVWALFVGLVGRVGAVRASVAGYLIPIFALVLGVGFLDERVEPLQIVGVAVALVGGYLVSRAAHRPQPEAAERPVQVGTADPPTIHMCR